MLITKDNSVRFKKFSPAMISMLNALYTIDQEQIPDFPEDIVITSANDSLSHTAKSKHYSDMALDVRSKNFKSLAAKQLFMGKLHLLLPKGRFTVLLEHLGKVNEHFHIQVKKGTDFP